MAPAGHVDSAFGSDGVVYVDFGNGSADVFNGLAIDALDRVVAVGHSTGQAPADIAVVRVHGGDQRLFVQQDANHNVTSVASRAGAVIDRYHYTPYGTRTVLNADFSVDTDGQSDADFRHGHQGLAIDHETGLYYNRARLLHPTLGRFTQRDPLGLEAGGLSTRPSDEASTRPVNPQQEPHNPTTCGSCRRAARGRKQFSRRRSAASLVVMPGTARIASGGVAKRNCAPFQPHSLGDDALPGARVLLLGCDSQSAARKHVPVEPGEDEQVVEVHLVVVVEIALGECATRLAVVSGDDE